MSDKREEAFSWQVAVWDRMASIYLGEVEPRFAGVIDGVMRRAGLRPDERVLALGAGSGSAAIKAAASIAPGGEVIAVDISPPGAAVRRTPARTSHAESMSACSGPPQTEAIKRPRNCRPKGSTTPKRQYARRCGQTAMARAISRI